MPELIIGIGGPKKKGPMMPPPGMMKAMKGAPPMDGKKPDVQGPDEADEPDEKAIPREAVCFRTSIETCGKCEYNMQGQCSKLQIAVQDGDGCNLFEDRNENEQDESEPQAGTMDREEQE